MRTPSPSISQPRLRNALRWIRPALAAALAVSFGADALAVNTLRGGVNNASSPSNATGTANVSQTSTAATNATAQAAQQAAASQQAQASLAHSLHALMAIQAAQNATRASVTAQMPANLGTALPNVPDGLAVNGLVPGVAGTDPSNPATTATTIPVQVDSTGSASVVLAKNTAITIPTNLTANTQVTVSGTGVVGTITTGGTITPLTGGAVTIVPPGSTISVTTPSTVTFAPGAGAAVPSTLASYALPAPASWTGISGVTQATYADPTSTSPGQTTVTLTQDSQQALLNWQTFNVGSKTVLDFDQSQGGANVGDWVAINKVADNIAPSQILGAIQAPGQVYVINQNGIIFGGASQINTHALVASSLPINDNLVSGGLLNNPDYQFLFSQVDIPAGSLGPTPAFTPQGTSSAPGTAPAPGSYGAGGIVAKTDSAGDLSLVPATGADGDVIVEAGAQLSSPTTAEHVGGRVALVGPNVSNNGTITTPDGQTILAAGLQVGFAAHPQTDPSIRGLDVSIGEVSDPTYDGGATGVSGTAANNGIIEAPRANTTIAGSDVYQNGVIDSLTSVTLNGSVDLLANYDAEPFVSGSNGFNGVTGLYATATGHVTLGPGSVTDILPDLTSTDTIVGTTLALNSQVTVQANTIYLAPDSEILAPGASVILDAGDWLPTPSGFTLANTSGQVYLDTGAVIDVSGSENVSASVLEDIVTASLLGTELADDPVQQDGALRGATVTVDIRLTGNYNGTEWVGTPLADLTGYVNLIQRTVGELTTSGGTVNIAAGNSVVMQPGSLINVSGGWINYQGAEVQTSQVVTSTGQVLDISQATPDLVYSGLYTGYTSTSPKYGLSQTYGNPLLSGSHFDPGYIQGGNGGSLTITAPSLALDGAANGASGGLFGYTVAGPYQQMSAASIVKTFGSTVVEPTMAGILGVPNASSLTLTFAAQNPADTGVYNLESPTPPAITFQNAPGGQQVAAAFDPTSLDLSANREDFVYLSPDLVNADGFGNLTITNVDGSITVPAGVTLSAGLGGSTSGASPVSGGSITFSAANIGLYGTITAPGGSLDFESADVSPYLHFDTGSSLPAYDPTRGNITVGSGAVLDTSGLIVNDSSGASAQEGLPLVTDGGSITLRASNVDLQAGSVLNASGGLAINAAGQQTFGQGGAITLQAGQDLANPAVLGGTLQLGATLESFSGATGGSLSLSAPLIQIGGVATDPTRTLLLDPAFFDQGGFGTFTLTGYGEQELSGGVPTGQYLPGIDIAPGTVIAPVVEGLQAQVGATDVSLTPVLEPLASERTPVNFIFNAPGVTNTFQGAGLLVVRGDFVMGEGASITTDPQPDGANGVTINAQTAAVLGSITAPGGTISITTSGTFPSLTPASEPLVTLDLGPDSVLSTAGVVEYTVNPYGYVTGNVLPGGTITLSGNIVAEGANTSTGAPGALLDASGATGILDVASSYTTTSSLSLALDRLQATRVDSSGGTITLKGAQELFTDATLRAAAGGPSAEGGSLVVSSGLFALPNTVTTPLAPNLIVSQDGATIPDLSFYPAGGTAIGYSVLDAQGDIIAGRGYFSVSSFDNPTSGFDSLTLGGTVQFEGSVTISANRSLSVASKGFLLVDPATANSVVTLDAPYVDLGQAFQAPLTAAELAQPVFFDSANNPFYQLPTTGTATLVVNAVDLLDVGNLNLQDIGTVDLNVSAGDLRGDGTLDAAANLTITARQVYPTTETVFTIADYDYNGTAGSVTLVATDDATLPDIPLSAGGTLNIYASDISQGGVLRAPIGTINLGSGVTSASPVDPLSNATVDPTRQLTLTPDSITSVSALEPDGQAVTIPYGTNLNGISWIDPSGTDITLGGVPGKTINLSGVAVDDEAGSLLDISGGGDLYAYRFVSGTGGTVDVLNTTTSFAILPGYQADFAPIDPTYGSSQGNSSTLQVGDQIYLAAGSGLPAGTYTLLPARYALLDGAFLVTPKSGAPATATVETNGATLVSGYRFNDLAPLAAAPLNSLFQVSPQSTVLASAEYDGFSANTFLSQSATAGNVAVPRLPEDAGQVIFAAQQSMIIAGHLESATAPGGLGSQVDISSPSAIYIGVLDANGDVPASVPAGDLFLDANNLTDFGADSLLVGGYRTQTAAGTTINVATNSLTVANAGAPLAGPDVILVSNQSLVLDAGSEIEQSGALSGAAQTLLLGSDATTGSGDGTLLRVTSDPTAQIARAGVDSQQDQAALGAGSQPLLMIGADTTISGTNLTLDSTYSTTLDASADLVGQTVSLDSGEISLELTTPAQPPTTAGLILSNTTLQTLEGSVQNLSLLAYNAIDVYGSGEVGGAPTGSGSTQVFPVASIALHADAIRGDGGTVVFNAGTLSIDDSAGGAETGSGPTSAGGGSITFNAGTVSLGQAGQTAANGVIVQGYGAVALDASSQILLQSAGSVAGDGTSTRGSFSLTADSSLTLDTPLLTGATAANQAITATGDLVITSPGAIPAGLSSGGLGAALSLSGQTVAIGGNVVLHSGSISATASAGDVTVGANGVVDVSGLETTTYNLTSYTSGGTITLASATGSIRAADGATFNVSAPSGGANAGTLNLSAPGGSFIFGSGTLLEGDAGAGGQGGTFTLDVGTIPGGSLASLESALDAGAFSQSVSVRDRDDALVTADGSIRTANFTLSTDTGSILVTGTVDASDVATTDASGDSIQVGGTINLQAAGGVELASGSLLTVTGQSFSDAGEGGSVTLGAGNYTTADPDNTSAYVTMDAGSRIDLSVAAVDGAADVGNATALAEAAGDFTGTLQIQAPQILDGNGNPTGIQVNPLAGTVVNASSITVVGEKVYQPAGGVIDTLDGANGAVQSNDNLFAAALGTTSAGAVSSPGTAANTLFAPVTITGLTPVINIEAGAVIVNPTGDLVLQKNWDLSTFRAGVNNLGQAVAGSLTLRASGNIVLDFGASLSDGFTPATGQTFNDPSGGMWQAALLPVGSQSWSYTLVAGADLTAANVQNVQPLASLASGSGSLLLGKGATALPTSTSNARNTTIIPKYFQTIRTGTGDIDIAAGRDVQILDPLATIYTAGTQVSPLADFDTPNLTTPSGTRFGTPQTPTPIAQYSDAGGNVTINAQNDIADYLISSTGVVTPYSTREMPTSWLYRRGFVLNGQFSATHSGGDVESTSWWVTFSNFFEGVGALGGGNVTLQAGHDVSNVDASVPTNARLPEGTPDASALVELGGGDLTVTAGNDINGGVYYVERGQGALTAGNSVLTNSTRAVLTTIELGELGGDTPDPTTWLPTTLFLGQGSFDVQAGNSVLLGPVANPFLLPQNVGNSFYDRTYFSTYASTSSVSVSALTGDLTIEDSSDTGDVSLGSWYQDIYQQVLNPLGGAYALSEPWLGLVETSVTPFETIADLLPPTLNATAFSGNIDIVGSITVTPSPTGNISLNAAGSVNGFQNNGVNDPSQTASVDNENQWGSSTINLSDANPASIPGIASPLSLTPGAGGLTASTWSGITDPGTFANVNSLFAVTGVTNSVLATQEALHTPGLLHAADSTPLYIYAGTGDISGINLYSGKSAQVVAGQDITDISFYIQNDNADDITLVQSGRDIIPYDPTSILRVDAQLSDNMLLGESPQSPNGQTTGAPNFGDIQLAGPGTLEVLAGRNLNLGVGPSNGDGTGAGITTIGNSADPYLPFAGADIFGGAGISGAAGLADNLDQIDIPTFVDEFLDPSPVNPADDANGSLAARYLPDLGTFLGLPATATETQVWTAFEQLPAAQQRVEALNVFYLVLRDAGRDHNTSADPAAAAYTNGFAAIQALFPDAGEHQGDITLTAREIKTTNGGDINLLAPSGQVSVGLNVAGTQAIDQGILTVDGGNINIFTNGNVNVGTSRIFTLHGGNEIIWSSVGDIAAGASSKTVQSAPPTRVIVDPQSANVETDLAGLATGGGIGVLETIAGAPPADVDLIAPNGTVDAGDAGIRVSGNLNIAAAQVLNASHISVSGSSAGTPSAPAAPNLAGLSAASSATGAASNVAAQQTRQNQTNTQPSAQDEPSIVVVQVLGYGGA